MNQYNIKQEKKVSEGHNQIFPEELKVYLCKISLTGVQGDHRGVMGGQNLPKKGEGLRQ